MTFQIFFLIFKI